MNINLDLFLQTLPYALKGWLAIFVVTIVIIAGTSLLNKLGAPKKDNQEESAE